LSLGHEPTGEVVEIQCFKSHTLLSKKCCGLLLLFARLGLAVHLVSHRAELEN